MTPEDIELLASKLSALLKMEQDDEDQEEKDKEDLEADGDEKDDLEADADEDKDEDKENLEASCPSGSNTFVPGEIDEKKARKMRSDSDRIKLSRLERQVHDLQEEVRTLRLQKRRTEREMDLKQLEAEGFRFDIVEELAHVETLDDPAYEKHMARARRLYQRLPVGGRFHRTEEPKVEGLTKDDARRIAKLAVEKGISYEAALTQFKTQEAK